MTDALVKPRRLGEVITVGGSNAEISGFTSRAVQIAVDALKERGGGTVKLSDGIYEIMAPIRLYDNIHLIGSGPKTILRKVDGFKTRFIIDADYGELKTTVEDASGFCPGMGVQLYDSQNEQGWAVTTAVVTDIEENTVHFDNYLVRDYKACYDGVFSNACSIIQGICVENVKVSDLTVDGNGETNEFLNGCRGGGIYFQKAKNCLVDNVKVSNFNGDGISWQITEDITVKNSEVSGCSNFGMHPGTGSLRTVVENCHLHHNGTDGIFVCWRVQHSLFKNNNIHDNGHSGINIGHKDINNLFESNHIFNNAVYGVLLREEIPSNAAHYNTYRKNVIENNGSAGGGYGFFIDSKAKGVVIEDNIIRDTGAGLQKTGILINQTAPDLKIQNNEMSGHADGDVVDKTA